MATAKELQAQLDAAHALMTERGVPIVAGAIADRIEVLLDAKGDVEKDLEFAESAPLATLIEKELDGDSSAEDRALAKAYMAYGTLAAPMIDTILAPILNLAAVKKLTQFQQDDLISSIDARVRAQLAVAMKVMAAADHPTLAAKLVDFTTKGSIVKVKLETVKTIENLTMLGRIGEGTLDIVFTDIKAIDNGTAKVAAKPTPDEPALPLEEAISATACDGRPGPPGDDDLVKAASPTDWSGGDGEEGTDGNEAEPEQETTH